MTSQRGIEDILAVQQDFSCGPLVAIELEDPVVGTQVGGFAAAGGADDGGDLVGGDLQVVVEQRLVLAIEEIQVARRNLGGDLRTRAARNRGDAERNLAARAAVRVVHLPMIAKVQETMLFHYFRLLNHNRLRVRTVAPRTPAVIRSEAPQAFACQSG